MDILTKNLETEKALKPLYGQFENSLYNVEKTKDDNLT